jgi:hypothetical protein
MALLGSANNHVLLIVASHYGRRSIGHGFPPIRLQETKNSASRPLKLEVNVQRLPRFKMPTWQYFLTKAMDCRRKFGSDNNGNLNNG